MTSEVFASDHDLSTRGHNELQAVPYLTSVTERATTQPQAQIKQVMSQTHRSLMWELGSQAVLFLSSKWDCHHSSVAINLPPHSPSWSSSREWSQPGGLVRPYQSCSYQLQFHFNKLIKSSKILHISKKYFSQLQLSAKQAI